MHNSELETFDKTINEIDECEIRFIMDSHGNGLDAKKMYRYKQTEIIILNKGEKNIKGAGKYCNANKSS